MLLNLLKQVICTFIVPVKYSVEKDYIHQCVAAIKYCHPGEKIVIVDSASEDKSYFNTHRDTIVLDVENKNFGTNAFKVAHDLFPDEDYYYCIYDSLILQSNLQTLVSEGVTAFRYFRSPPTGWGWDDKGVELSVWAQEQMFTHTGYSIPDEFRGMMGPMFIASNDAMSKIDESGLFNIYPEDKYQLCAMERIYGIVLQFLGYDFWTNAPQGEMTDFYGQYPEDKVVKLNAARM